MKDKGWKEEQENGAKTKSDVRVRELWVGNLPEGVTEESVYA